MDVLLWILAAVCVGAGIAGVVLPVLPGAPLVWLGLLFAAWADGFTRVSGWTLAFLAVLAASTVVIDLVAGALGAKRVKASGWAIAGEGAGVFLPSVLAIGAIRRVTLRSERGDRTRSSTGAAPSAEADWERDRCDSTVGGRASPHERHPPAAQAGRHEPLRSLAKPLIRFGSFLFALAGRPASLGRARLGRVTWRYSTTSAST